MPPGVLPVSAAIPHAERERSNAVLVTTLHPGFGHIYAIPRSSVSPHYLSVSLLITGSFGSHFMTSSPLSVR